MELEGEYLYWPSDEEREEIESETETELKGCVGWIDGTDIKLSEAPIGDKDSFYDKDKVKT